MISKNDKDCNEQMKYGYPLEINRKYWIRQIVYKCNSCNNTFIYELPVDDDVVKLVEKDGEQVKWLPAHGVGGFVDVVYKLAPAFRNEKFGGIGSWQLTKFLEDELPKHTEKGVNGNGFIVGGNKQVCPKCKSKDLSIIEAKVLENPKLDWVMISKDLLK